LITTSGFVINSLKGLDHSDYIIGMCPYYIIKLISAERICQPAEMTNATQRGVSQDWVCRIDRQKRLDDFPTDPRGSGTHITPSITGK